MTSHTLWKKIYPCCSIRIYENFCCCCAVKSALLLPMLSRSEYIVVLCVQLCTLSLCVLLLYLKLKVFKFCCYIRLSNLGPVQWKSRFNSYNLTTALNAYLFRLTVKALYFEVFPVNVSLLEFNFTDFQLLHCCSALQKHLRYI